MGIILDTNVFIAVERSKKTGNVPAIQDLVPRDKAGQEVFISIISVSELLVGVHRATTPARQASRQAFVDSVLDQFSAIPIDLRVAREHSRLTARLITDGTPIGTHDSWIAATALAFGYSLMTENVREFERIPNLQLI